MLSPAVCMWIVDDDYGWNKLKFVTRRAPMPASWLSHTLGRRRISPLSSCQKSGDMKAPSTRMVRMRQAGQGLSPAPIGTKWHQVPSSSTPSGADAGGKITSARRLSEKNYKCSSSAIQGRHILETFERRYSLSRPTLQRRWLTTPFIHSE